jgi:hypothetical protein
MKNAGKTGGDWFLWAIELTRTGPSQFGCGCSKLGASCPSWAQKTRQNQTLKHYWHLTSNQVDCQIFWRQGALAETLWTGYSLLWYAQSWLHTLFPVPWPKMHGYNAVSLAPQTYDIIHKFNHLWHWHTPPVLKFWDLCEWDIQGILLPLVSRLREGGDG